MPIPADTIAHWPDAALAAALVVSKFFDLRERKTARTKSDTTLDRKLDTRFQGVLMTIDHNARLSDQQHREAMDAITKVGFLLGEGHENGVRGDVKEIKERVGKLEDRERDRLSARDVGSYTPLR